MALKTPTLLEEFLELLEEIGEYRHGHLESLAGLIEAKAWTAIKEYYKNPQLRQFLTEGEADFLKSIVMNHSDEDDRLN